jgi:acyl-CoA reductase-like NAD-dependent aldehyde dehydrogenase
MVKKIAKKKTITKVPAKKVLDNSYQKEVDRIFALQKENRWKIATSTAKERIEKLKKLKEQIEIHSQEIRDALYKDFKKRGFSFY